jgi:hypothetical protein
VSKVLDLLTAKSIAERPGTYIRRHGTVVAEFNHLSQDSGNVSWLVDTVAGRLFVKTAGLTDLQLQGAPVPYFNYEGRVRLLASIDERTTVFNLGRLIWHFGTRLSERVEDFCGPAALAQVVLQACQLSRTARPSSVASFVNAWTSARQ